MQYMHRICNFVLQRYLYWNSAVPLARSHIAPSNNCLQMEVSLSCTSSWTAYRSVCSEAVELALFHLRPALDTESFDLISWLGWIATDA